MRRLSSLDKRWKFICIARGDRGEGQGLRQLQVSPRFQDRLSQKTLHRASHELLWHFNWKKIYAPAANFWETSPVGRWRRDESTVFSHVRVAALMPLKGWKITSQVIIKRSLRTTLVVLSSFMSWSQASINLNCVKNVMAYIQPRSFRIQHTCLYTALGTFSSPLSLVLHNSQP